MVGYGIASFIATASLAFTSQPQPTDPQSCNNNNNDDKSSHDCTRQQLRLTKLKQEEEECRIFQNLCQKIGDSEEDLAHVLYLATDEDGIRGVRVRERVEAGGEVLRVPLKFCLRDDRPPEWLDHYVMHGDEECGDGTVECLHEDDYEKHIDKWSLRLASSLIDLELNGGNEVQELWKNLFPDPLMLRASLPVHWSDEALEGTRCTALQIASDAAFFARSDAVNVIMDGIETVQGIQDDGEDVENLIGEPEVQQALDLVQTRSCRVKRHDGFGPTLRLLAPIFDFINHGGTLSNAKFELEDDSLDQAFCISTDYAKLEKKPALVVRAKKTIEEGEEVLIDYGDSAKPEWKCLSSYGFVPNHSCLLDEEFEEDYSSAEIFMHGKRYEINSSVIPTDLVLDVADVLRVEEGIEIDEENPLTAAVALHIAARISDVACQLLEIKPDEARSPAEQKAYESSASFVKAQHEVLVATAAGLREYATRMS